VAVGECELGEGDEHPGSDIEERDRGCGEGVERPGGGATPTAGSWSLSSAINTRS
jgi:hypothetical protein